LGLPVSHTAHERGFHPALLSVFSAGQRNLQWGDDLCFRVEGKIFAALPRFSAAQDPEVVAPDWRVPGILRCLRHD
jgi:hypothetical protein